MKRYRSAAGVIVKLVDDDTATRLLGPGWVDADAPEPAPADDEPKRKPGRPRKTTE